jgi:hypothetical protein
MMDFTVTEKMKVILEMINEFVDKELIPLEPAFLTQSAAEMMPVIKAKQKKVKQMDLNFFFIPKCCFLSTTDHIVQFF